MTDIHFTVGVEPDPRSDGQPIPEPDDDILDWKSDEIIRELTRTIAAAYSARGLSHRARGEFDLALSDLDQALRHDPDNAEARLVRSRIPRDRGDDVTEAAPDGRPDHELDDYGPESGGPYHMAGYAVVADPRPFGGVVGALLETHPLTPEGRDDAVAWADYLSRMPELREEAFDGVTPAREPNFDALVIEVRAVARVIHIGQAMDEDGDLLPCKIQGGVPSI